jgi:hypothetical protein
MAATTCVVYGCYHIYHSLSSCMADISSYATRAHGIIIKYILLIVVNGCQLAIMQSSIPMWFFEHSGPITLCACLDALMSSCCTTCRGESKFMRLNTNQSHVSRRVPSCTDEAYIYILFHFVK